MGKAGAIDCFYRYGKRRMSVGGKRSTEAKKRARGHTTAPYSEAQKLKAVAAARAANPDHMLGKAALLEAQRVVGAPIGLTTLDSWIKQYDAQVQALAVPEPSMMELVRDTQADVLQHYADVQKAALEHALKPAKLESANFKDLVLGASIANTKIAEAAGITPSERDLLLQFKRECLRRGYDVLDVLADGLAK